MEIFDYLIIAFSLLFTTAALRLIRGISSANDSERRYWIHLLFILWTLLAIVSSFWSYWSLKDITWTLPKFILALLLPSIYYFIAVLLVPENINNIKSWREHYYSIRIKLFSSVAIWFIIATVSGIIFFEMSLRHPARLGHLIFISLCIVGLLFTNPKVHWAIVIIFIILSLAAILQIGAQPGWLNN